MKNIKFKKWSIGRNNNFYLYQIIIFLFLFKFYLSYIVLPFKYNNLPQPTNLTEIVYNLIENQLIITLPLGTPKTIIDFYPSMNLYLYYLEEGSCLTNSISSYNISNSDSFLVNYYLSSCHVRLDSCLLVQDKLYLYDDIDLKNTIEVPQFKFYYGKRNNHKKNNNNKLCGRLGFQLENLPYHYYDYFNFITTLKKNEIIKSYSWYIHHYEKPYKKNDKEIYDGAIIFDIFNEEFYKDFPNIQYENDYYYNTINTRDYEAILAWILVFDKIYYNINNTRIDINDKESGLAFETNFVICPKGYFEYIKLYFFNYYFQNNICFLMKGKYHYIYCSKDKFKENVKDFPTLNFRSNGLDRTFILTGEDLFQEYNNSLLFMIIFKEYSYKYWTLGNVFMKKYNFFFDSDKKTIGCFDIIHNKKEKEKYKFINFLNKIKWYLFIFIGIIIGFFLGKKIREQARKLRANELEDKYEYLENKANNQNKNNISNYKEIKSQLYDYNSNK